MYDDRRWFRVAFEADDAGPDASEPRETVLCATFIAFPAPPRPVVRYVLDVEMDGCGSTMEYLWADMIGSVNGADWLNTDRTS